MEEIRIAEEGHKDRFGEKVQERKRDRERQRDIENEKISLKKNRNEIKETMVKRNEQKYYV